MSVNKYSIASNSTQDLKCENIGISMPDRDLAILHIQDAEQCLWHHSERKRRVEIPPVETLLSLSAAELETLYVQKFRELQLIYAPALPEVSETPDSEQVELVGEAPFAGAHKDADVEQPAPSPPQPAPAFKPTTTPSQKPLPRASPTHQKSDIDWDELAPQIIVPVTKELFDGRPMRETSQGLRIGNKGSLVVNPDMGVFNLLDPDENAESYGVIGLVQYALRVDKAAAIRWLDDKGYLDNAFTVSDAPHIKPKPNRKSKRQNSDDRGSYDYGLTLWRQSKPIPRSFNHAARRWAAHRNLLPLLLPFPTGIRFGVYDDKKRGERPYIIVLACPLSAWGDAYPHLPKPEPLKIQFQALWIDRLGNPVEQEDGGNKRTYGRFGEVDDSAVLCIGDPTADRVSVAEGVADALSIYSRRDGAVLATLGKPTGLCDKPNALESLALDGRIVRLYGDNDPDPDGEHWKKLETLGRMVADLGARAKLGENPSAEDPADAAAKDPFSIINRVNFDSTVKRYREQGSYESERDAWFSILGGGDFVG